MGARPSHAEWQGKVFWRNYPEGNYENFYQATGYGTATGLGGYNCRHQFYAFFGEDDVETYEHIDETVNKQAYDMEQKQRSLERKLRKWDREKKILEAGGQDTTEAKRWKRYYQEQIKNLVDSSDGFLKRNYSAEKAWSNTSPVLEHEKGSSKQSDTRVNWEYENFSAYHEKFKTLTSSEEVNEALYAKAMDMLRHRDGTEMEDLHLIDINTGKVVASQTHSTVKNEVTANKAVLRATKKYKGSLVGIHNHPGSKRPSGGDYATAKNRSYRKAYVICHNGTIYEYWYGKKNISSMLIDMKVAQKEQDFYNEYEAYEEAMKELARDYGIGWRKI